MFYLFILQLIFLPTIKYIKTYIKNLYKIMFCFSRNKTTFYTFYKSIPSIVNDVLLKNISIQHLYIL